LRWSLAGTSRIGDTRSFARHAAQVCFWEERTFPPVAPIGRRCLAFLGAGPGENLGAARWAGVEERSVKETAGTRADYGDLAAAVGWLLKRRLL
jgi:hypothetical protein